MVLRVYLLRHGETEFSRTDRFCGRIDAALTRAGHEMAGAFAAHYAPLPWHAIYSSTRQRAVATAHPLASATGLPIVCDPLLDEISYGEWQGYSKREIAARDPERLRDWLENPAMGTPGGESVYDVAERAMTFIERLRVEHERGSVLVVSHKTVLRALVCRLLDFDLRHYRDYVAQPTGGVTIVDFGPYGSRFRAVGDTTHLPPALRARALHELVRRPTEAAPTQPEIDPSPQPLAA